MKHDLAGYRRAAFSGTFREKRRTDPLITANSGYGISVPDASIFAAVQAPPEEGKIERQLISPDYGRNLRDNFLLSHSPAFVSLPVSQEIRNMFQNIRSRTLIHKIHRFQVHIEFLPAGIQIFPECFQISPFPMTALAKYFPLRFSTAPAHGESYIFQSFR